MKREITRGPRTLDRQNLFSWLVNNVSTVNRQTEINLQRQRETLDFSVKINRFTYRRTIVPTSGAGRQSQLLIPPAPQGAVARPAAVQLRPRLKQRAIRGDRHVASRRCRRNFCRAGKRRVALFTPIGAGPSRIFAYLPQVWPQRGSFHLSRVVLPVSKDGEACRGDVAARWALAAVIYGNQRNLDDPAGRGARACEAPRGWASRGLNWVNFSAPPVRPHWRTIRPIRR